MRSFNLIAMLWLCCSSAQGASLDPPLAEAAQGKLQCYTPDAARKTCQSLAGYGVNNHGAIENTAVVLLSQIPTVTMRTVSLIEIKTDRVCGYIRPLDIESATFTVSGRPAQAAETTMLRRDVQMVVKSSFDREICTAYFPDGEGLRAKVNLGGVPHPEMDQKVIWVSPSDGYTVGP